MVTLQEMYSCRHAMVQSLIDHMFSLDTVEAVHLYVLCQLPNGDMINGLDVPVDFIKEGYIQLNIKPSAIQSMVYNKDIHSYEIVMTFGAMVYTVLVPINLIVQVIGLQVDITVHPLVEDFTVFVPRKDLMEQQVEEEVVKKPNHLSLVH